MQPRGPLMIEHRLIERMVEVLRRKIADIDAGGGLSSPFVDGAADFIRTYADRTHHGKEEDILFRELSKKELSEADARTMDELVQEHVLGRQLTSHLVEAEKDYSQGDNAALRRARDAMQALVDFYPQHIAKEDDNFFPAAMGYLTDEEQQEMLDEFREFDRAMIHEKYRAVAEDFESTAPA